MTHKESGSAGEASEARSWCRTGRPFPRQAPAGTPGDIVDWEAVFLTLKEIDFDGYVEMVTYQWFPPDYHRSAYVWARELGEKTGL